MVEILMRLEGDGIRRMIRAAEALGARGRTEMQRGLISGGRKLTTKVKRSLESQTNLKKRSVDRRVSGRFDSAVPAWIITGHGKGVTLDEVKGTKAGGVKPRDPSRQPRDAFGRFAEWPNPRIASGLVSSAPWGASRRFAYSYRDHRGRLVSAPPHLPINVLYGPAVWKELVKDESAAAFHRGARDVEAEILKRITRLTGGVLS